MTTAGKLSDEDRILVRDIVAGLTGEERRRQSARVRSIVLRMTDDYRRADNARQAALERAKYHANISVARTASAAKQRRRMARIKSQSVSSESAA
jgi:hypothetical protein